MSIDVRHARALFEKHFGFEAELGVRAPGRVNIIGEHTDYNHGFVMPMALERETVILARRRQDTKMLAFAANLEREVEVDLRDRRRHAGEPWIDYVIGVADEVAKLGRPLSGADVMISGDVPIGCGLSSSASLEMAALTLFEALGGFDIGGVEGARLGQRVENGFLGLNSGIMDQFISRMAKAGHALFLDCRSLESELVPVAFPDATFVIANTCLARGLTASKYNERVSECNEAVRVLRDQTSSQGTHLRDFSMKDLDACRENMADNVYRRARHVISENARTVQAREMMRSGDVQGLGALMTESDHSLRQDYEVTSPELDAMTRSALAIDGCYGARMTGAGFGGCTINLVRKDKAETFARQLMADYLEQTGYQGQIILSSPAAGAGLI